MDDKSSRLRTKDGNKDINVLPSALQPKRTLLVVKGGHAYLTPGEVKKLAAYLLKTIEV